MIRRILYWLAVVAVATLLTYLIIRLAEGLDASQIGTDSRSSGGRDAALVLEAGNRDLRRIPLRQEH